MKASIVLASLIGSLTVYSTMAACTGADRASRGDSDDDGDTSGEGGFGGFAGTGQGGQSGQGGTSGTSGEDAGFMDVFMDAMPDASADPVSGARLKAKYRSGADGSKAYLPGSWYDSQRQESCAFYRASDGKERCLPLEEGYAQAGFYFTDAACTVPLAIAPLGCAPKYALGTTGESCYGSSGGYAYKISSIGANVSPAMIYSKSGADCYGGQASQSIAYYTVGAEVPPSSFVEGSVTVDQ
jgi:hypothetical protein